MVCSRSSWSVRAPFVDRIMQFINVGVSELLTMMGRPTSTSTRASSPSHVLALALLILVIDLFLPKAKKRSLPIHASPARGRHRHAASRCSASRQLRRPPHHRRLHGSSASSSSPSVFVMLVSARFVQDAPAIRASTTPSSSSRRWARSNGGGGGAPHGLHLAGAAELRLYVLVSYAKINLKSNEAGLKYMLLGAFASALLLYGISFIYGSRGSTTYAESRRFAEDGGDFTSALLLACADHRRPRLQGRGRALPHVDAGRLRRRAAADHRLPRGDLEGRRLRAAAAALRRRPVPVSRRLGHHRGGRGDHDDPR